MIWVTLQTYLNPSDIIAPGEQKTFTFNITAPSSPGLYFCRWQMQKEWTGTNSWFGTLLNVPVTVGNASTENCADGIDNDDDSFIDCSDSDCNGQFCDDGIICTETDICSGGICSGTNNNILCNDGNLCTSDTCDPATGCVNTNNTAPCDDGSACTTADTCAAGACVGGAPPNCDDSNVCTDDSCDPATGCVNANNTAPCDDGDACTTADTCAGGACVGGAPPDCDDANVCTDDSCDPATGCVNANNTASCDDG